MRTSLLILFLSLSFFSGAPMTWLSTNGTSAATNLYIPANATAALIGQVWVFAGATNVDLSAVVQP